MILDEFFHDLAQCKLIDRAERTQPTDLLPDLFKDALPVDHLFEFVFDVSLLLDFDSLVSHILANLLQLRHNIAVEVLITKGLLQIVQVLIAHWTLQLLARRQSRSSIRDALTGNIRIDIHSVDLVRILRSVHSTVALQELDICQSCLNVSLFGHTAPRDR